MDNLKKIERIKKLISRLDDGVDISITSLSRVLTGIQLDQFRKDWEDELSTRKVEKPHQLKIYENKIKIGTLHYQKMERYSFTKDKNRLAKKFSDKAENAFEKAIEYLIEQLQADSNLRMWIDREPDGLNLTPMGIPRVIGSSSFECLIKTKTPYPVITKRELKMRTLESALSDLTDSPLDSHCEPEKIITFRKSKSLDFSDFRF